MSFTNISDASENKSFTDASKNTLTPNKVEPRFVVISAKIFSEEQCNEILDDTIPDRWGEMKFMGENTKLAKAKAKGLYFIKKNQLKESYIIDVKNDLKILTAIQQDWKILEKKEFQDPKTEAIKTFIQDQFKKDPKRKIIILTEFSDTAKYL